MSGTALHFKAADIGARITRLRTCMQYLVCRSGPFLSFISRFLNRQRDPGELDRLKPAQRLSSLGFSGAEVAP